LIVSFTALLHRTVTELKHRTGSDKNISVRNRSQHQAAFRQAPFAVAENHFVTGQERQAGAYLARSCRALEYNLSCFIWLGGTDGHHVASRHPGVYAGARVKLRQSFAAIFSKQWHRAGQRTPLAFNSHDITNPEPDFAHVRRINPHEPLGLIA
jgi:hypothetical protein